MGDGQNQSSRAPWKPSSPPLLPLDKNATFGRVGGRHHPSYASNMNLALLDEEIADEGGKGLLDWDLDSKGTAASLATTVSETSSQSGSVNSSNLGSDSS